MSINATFEEGIEWKFSGLDCQKKVRDVLSRVGCAWAVMLDCSLFSLLRDPCGDS
jgi:hypothetical protein